MPRWPTSERALAALLFVGVALLWSPALANGFVWDDWNNILTSTRLREWSALYEVFLHDAMWSANLPAGSVSTYRPLSLASMVIDYKLFGLAPWGYHLSSVLLHAGAAVAVFGALSRFVDSRAALGIALLWAVHPTAIEVAGWINGRSESFALLFGAAALWVLCVPRPSGTRLAAGAGLIALAMLGKETGGVFAPGAILMVAEAQRRAGERCGILHWPTAIAAVAGVALYVLLRANALGGGTAPSGGALSVKVLMVLPAIWFHALQTVAFPLDRALHHLHLWLVGLTPLIMAGYAVAAAVLTGLVVAAWRRGHRLLGLGLLWWFASLTPIALLVVSSWPGFYRWLYIGLPGLYLAIYAALFLQREVPRWLFVGLLALSVLGVQRAIPVWKNSGTLFLAMIEEQPEEPFGYNGLGDYFRDSGNYALAEEALRRGIAIGPRRPDIYFSLGSVLAVTDRCQEAIEVGRGKVGAARVPKEFSFLVGDCWSRKGRPEVAKRLFRLCAGLDPRCDARLKE